MCAPLKSRVTTHPLIHISTHSNIQYPHKQVKSHLSPRACTHAASHICSLPKELYSLPKESSILLKERFRMATIRSMPNRHMLFSTKEPCLLPKEPSIPLKSATGWRKYVGCLIFRGHSPKQSPVSYGVATISRLVKIIVSFAKEPYKRDDILQKRPIILRSLLIVATPYQRSLVFCQKSALQGGENTKNALSS